MPCTTHAALALAIVKGSEEIAMDDPVGTGAKYTGNESKRVPRWNGDIWRESGGDARCHLNCVCGRARLR